MSKKFAVLFCAMFVVFITTCFALNVFSSDREFSDIENRPLAQKPEFSTKELFYGQWTENYEKYITDQFAFRDEWVGGKYVSERLLLKRENNGIYFAGGNRLIARFDIPEAKRLENNFLAVDKLAQKTGLPTKLMLAPTSAHVYKDALPKYAPSYDQNLLFERAKQLKKAEYIDVQENLIKNKEDYIYYRTDHHWTTTGAYIAYKDYMKAVGRESEILPWKDLQKIRKEIPDFVGTLASQSGARGYSPDTIDYYNFENLVDKEPEKPAGPIYDLSFADKKGKYSIFFGGDSPLHVITNTDESAKGTLMVLKDSFANSILPFLAQHYKEIHVFDPRYNRLDIKTYAETWGIEEILVMYQTGNFATDVNVGLIGK